VLLNNNYEMTGVCYPPSHCLHQLHQQMHIGKALVHPPLRSVPVAARSKTWVRTKQKKPKNTATIQENKTLQRQGQRKFREVYV
jgi:hypothetical protein